jgi:ribose transport system substrate-binding protein/D-allose transport system substrate-binding protein
VDVDGNISEDMAKQLGIPVAFSVASDNYALGAEAARYLTSHSSLLPSDQILVLEGTAGTDPSQRRVQGFKDALGSRATIISSQAADWDRARAATITSQIILKYPRMKAIFAANDTMALGALEALRSNGASSVHVIGIDGSSDAIKAIKAGRLTASIAQLPYLMAKEAVEKSKKGISGEKPLHYQQFVPIMAIDAEILRESSNPLLRYMR